MADEEIENLPGEEKAEKKGASPIVPLLLVIILVPGLTFAVNQFVLVPKIKGMVEEVAKEIHEPKEKKEEAAGVQTYEFEDIVANLSGALRSRYVKVSFTVEGTSADFVDKIEANKAKIIDASLGTLSALNIMDLEQPGIRNILRNDLLAAFESALKEDIIKQLYFSEFVVQ